MQITTGYKLYGCPIILGSLITWFDIIPNNFDIIVSVWATLFVPESCKRHLFIYLINNFTISSSLSCKFITIRQKLISTITLQEIRHDHSRVLLFPFSEGMFSTSCNLFLTPSLLIPGTGPCQQYIL